MERVKQISLYIFFGLLAYMPLHIFLSTWIGTTFGILELAKVAKDILLFVGFILIFAASIREPWFKKFMSDKLVWLIGAYALLTLLLAALKPTDQDAEILAVVYNLRFLLYFLYAALLTRHYKADWLKRKALRVVLIVALPVLIFGIVQYLWLPTDGLTHVGYSRENGVLPAFFIDDKPDLERVMSTVRDPNSYGSYLLIILAMVLAYLLRVKNKDLRNALIGFAALTIINLYLTFSRGAWIGAIIMVLATYIINYISRKDFRLNKGLLIIAAAALLVLGGALFAARDTYFVKNVILHADESTVLEDPNELRLRFWRESLDAATENPLGYGPGTAGLASVRNDEQGTILNENYYLQILYEVGVIGLLLLGSIFVIVFVRLMRVTDALAIAMFAAFIGLLITNFLVHIWTNEAVAYTFWGLAGILVFTVKEKHDRRTIPRR